MFNKKLKEIIEKQQEQIVLLREMTATQQQEIENLNEEIINIEHYLGLVNFKEQNPRYSFMQIRQDIKHKRMPRRNKA